MLWFVFALLAAVISSAQNLLHRQVLFKANPYAYAFLENIFSFLIFLPFAILAWQLPAQPAAWLILAIGGLLWTAIAVIGMFSYKYTKVSLRAPISESRTLWVVVLSALLLAEAITTHKVVGVLIIFLGVVLLTYKKGAPFGSLDDKGVQLTLLVAFLLALVAVVDKKALAYFNPSVYAMLVYLIPTVLIGAYALTRLQDDVRSILRHQAWFLLFVVIFGAASYFLTLKAFSLADVSLVYPVLRTSTIFTVIGGIIFLHEREDVWRKLVAALIVVLGVLVVSGYYPLASLF